MRSLGTREAGSMAENREVPLDRAQVRVYLWLLSGSTRTRGATSGPPVGFWTGPDRRSRRGRPKPDLPLRVPASWMLVSRLPSRLSATSSCLLPASTKLAFASQVKKAVQALQAFLKSKSSGDVLLLDDSQPISLLFTLWKIPRQTQTIRIPLPHGQRSDTDEVCLFTKDEPRMTAEQTQRFYKKLLEERGVTNVSEIIPLKTLKTEYKPYEAKRRLLGNFDMFLSDARIRRLLPSHLGKHFYKTKKMPISIDLQSNNLGRDVQRLVQGTRLTITNRGCCSMAHVAHSNMTADEVTENVEAAVRTVAAKLRMKGPIMKLIHLKSQSSVALPIYTSDLSHVSVLRRSKVR
uniref:Ribosomal L1 domain-containing protein 1 n=1 Tax=Xiphophorus maculatus TaxID=8083 RepID=A0A3B5PY95_XIPMA